MSPLGQRSGADGHCRAGVVGAGRGHPAVHGTGSPWENGYIESFNGKLRDELLDRELFYTLAEAQILTERWRQEYTHLRRHSALGYRPPAPEAIAPLPLRLSSVALPEMPTLT